MKPADPVSPTSPIARAAATTRPMKCSVVASPTAASSPPAKRGPAPQQHEPGERGAGRDRRLEEELRAHALLQLEPQGAQAVVVDEQRDGGERGAGQAEHERPGVEGARGF